MLSGNNSICNTYMINYYHAQLSNSLVFVNGPSQLSQVIKLTYVFVFTKLPELNIFG